MRLVIEKSDESSTGMKAGEYDLDDIGAVNSITTGRIPFVNTCTVELHLDQTVKPEPGSSGEPHYKVGVRIEDGQVSPSKVFTVFARPAQGQAIASKAMVTAQRLAGAANPETVIETEVQVAMDEVIERLEVTLMNEAISMGTTTAPKFKVGDLVYFTYGPGRGSSRTIEIMIVAIDQNGVIKGVESSGRGWATFERACTLVQTTVTSSGSLPPSTCSECKDTGFWANPGNPTTAPTPCSQGCVVP